MYDSPQVKEEHLFKTLLHSSGRSATMARYYNPGVGKFIAEDPLWRYSSMLQMYSYTDNNPVRYTDPSGLKVQKCCAPNDIGGLAWTKIPHCWIKTDKYEAGMGPLGGGIPVDRCFAEVRTQITDHTGEAKNRKGAKCWDVPNVDEKCINKAIAIGAGPFGHGATTGFWCPGANDCHTVADKIISRCGTYPNCPVCRGDETNPMPNTVMPGGNRNF